MKFAINCSYPLGLKQDGAQYVQLAQSMESSGYNTFWIGDHIVIPPKFDAQSYPYAAGLQPNVAWPDPFGLLCAVAVSTKRILLGTSVAVLPYRSPLPIAQSVATVDLMSNGRFLFGIGAGWMREEFDALGVPFNERGERTNESLRIMKTIWCGTGENFAGRFYTLPDVTLNPMPIQKPHPPIIVGGEGLPAYKRIAEFGDGWQGGFRSPDAYRAQLDQLKPLMEERGRDLASLFISMAATPDYVLSHRREVDELEKLGVAEILLHPKWNSMDEALRGVESLGRRLMGPT